jgi:hypothetical protein
MNNKILLLAVVLTLGISANSFGSAGTAGWKDRQPDGSVKIPGGTNSLPDLTLKPSANVFFSWAVDTTGVAYSIGTLHTSGTFTYATTSTDTNIYRWANTDQSSTSLTAYSNTTAKKCPDSPANATEAIAWEAGWTASK